MILQFCVVIVIIDKRKENNMTTTDELQLYVKKKILVKEMITEIYDNEPITALGVPQRGISMLSMFERGQVDFEYIQYLHENIMKTKNQ